MAVKISVFRFLLIIIDTGSRRYNIPIITVVAATAYIDFYLPLLSNPINLCYFSIT